MITHKKLVKWAGAALVVVATFIGVAASGVVVADELDKTEVYAKHEAACFIFGKAAGIDDMQVHANRVRDSEVDARMISYVLGYHTGALDVYGSINTRHFGSYVAARKDAATAMYKQFSCSVMTSI